MKDEVLVAIAGNPNVGKTAVLNHIAGSKLKVGNWPGVTVTKKEAALDYNGKKIRLVDLPGIYALSPYSLEERVARDFLIEKQPDFIINVIDSTNIERNLYLSTQLAELGIPMVMALNMWDEFKKKEYSLKLNKFKKLWGVDVVTTVGKTGENVDLLIEKGLNAKKPNKVKYVSKIEEVLNETTEFLNKIDYNYKVPKRWYSLKLLEKDQYVVNKFTDEKIAEYFKAKREEIESSFKEDIESIIGELRYGHISGLLKDTFTKPVEKKKDLTDKIDSVILNRVVGIPIFFGLMYLVFKLTFEGSGPFIDWVDGFIADFVGKYILAGFNAIGSPDWLNSLVGDGIIAGVGGVLVFVPLLMFLYFFLALLEESGYMARAAFVMDRFMRSIGLPGKAFIPLLIGFGCNVPAIYATRTLDNENDRKLTTFLVPFMSCGARLPVYALFVAAFFRTRQAGIIFSLYLLGIIIAIVVGLILKKVFFKGETAPLIMELPPYRIPTIKMLWSSMWSRSKSFIRKAGTVIFAAMIVIWVLTNIPYGVKTEDTIYYKSAKSITFVFEPLGFGKTEPVASLLPGLVAKEVVVGAFGQLYNVENQADEGENIYDFGKDLGNQIVGFKDASINSFKAMFGNLKTGAFSPPEHEEDSLTTKIRKDFTPLSAYSYMVFIVFFIPCIVVLGAVYQEFGLNMLLYITGLTVVVPWIMSFLIYNFGQFLGLG